MAELYLVEQSDMQQSAVRMDTDLFHYYMNNARRGECIVFNNEIFQPSTGLPPRYGSIKDVRRVEDVFSRLGFTVVVHNNMTAVALIQAIHDGML